MYRTIIDLPPRAATSLGDFVRTVGSALRRGVRQDYIITKMTDELERQLAGERSRRIDPFGPR